MAKTRRNKQKKALPNPGPNQCHPRVGHVRPAAGCLPLEVYKRVATRVGVEPSLPPAQLRHMLETKLSVQPNQEYSFLQATPLSSSEKSKLAHQYLRPIMPSNWKQDPDQWLDSTNIESVMKQYEEAYPEFEFLGPFPIDFAHPDPYAKGGTKCLIEEMCDIDLDNFFTHGKKYIGIIYNLDPHYKGGSHWVANFVDIPGHKTYYFDSYGMAPPKPVAKFMKWLASQDPRMKLFYNSRRFQFQGSECGMYSLYFIIRMLHGDQFRAFTRVAPRDSAILDLRDWLFSV